MSSTSTRRCQHSDRVVGGFMPAPVKKARHTYGGPKGCRILCCAVRYATCRRVVVALCTVGTRLHGALAGDAGRKLRVSLVSNESQSRASGHGPNAQCWSDTVRAAP